MLVNGLPKIRSGRIPRRMLREMASGETEHLGDAPPWPTRPSSMNDSPKGRPPQVKR